MKLVRLRDIKDILRVFSDLGGLIDIISPSRAIESLKRIQKQAEREARAQQLSDDEYYLDDRQTYEYIEIITCKTCVSDEVTRRAIFAHQHQIAPLNRVIEALADLELISDGVLVSLAACDDYHRLAYAFQRIESTGAALSQYENQYIVQHHEIAVSLTNIFIALYPQEYGHSLMMQFMQDLENCNACMTHLNANESYVYARRSEDIHFVNGRAKHGLVQCIERLAYNNVRLTSDDLLFLMTYPDITMSLANIFLLLSTVNIDHATVQFRDMFSQELYSHLLEHEEQSAKSVTSVKRLILPKDAAGFVAVLKRLCVYADFVTMDQVAAIVANLAHCHDYMDAFEDVATSSLPDKQHFLDLLALNPMCAKRLVSLIHRLTPLSSYAEVADLHLQKVTLGQLHVLDHLFDKVLPENLRTTQNLRALLASPRSLNNVRRLLKCICNIHQLDQDCFELCLKKSRVMPALQGLNAIIASKKINAEIIYRAVSLDYTASFVVAGMRELLKINKPNLDSEAVCLFDEPRLALNIAATLVVHHEEGISMPLHDVVEMMREDHPLPDVEANPYPRVLTGWSPSLKKMTFSPTLFHLSLGDSPTSRHLLVDEDDLSTECSL